MLHLPFYINAGFILATIYTVLLFWKAARYSRITLIVILCWMLLQGFVGYSLFYTETKHIPPRFLLLVVPPLLAIISLFVTRKGRHYLEQLHMPSLLLMNMVRVPVELVLFGLFVHEAIPQIMTFEGNNLDILSGITAPVVWYLCRLQKNKGVLLAWNITCLLLLVNIVTIAILAAPFRFQQIAFDQPNTGVLYFPFVWLPCVIVPLVLLSHLAMIRRLVVHKKNLAPARFSL